MVWGSVGQRIVIKELPDGVKMYITAVELIIPEGKNEWWPTFNTRAEVIHKNITVSLLF